MAAPLTDLRTTGPDVPGGIIRETMRIPTDRIRTCLPREISAGIWSRSQLASHFDRSTRKATNICQGHGFQQLNLGELLSEPRVNHTLGVAPHFQSTLYGLRCFPVELNRASTGVTSKSGACARLADGNMATKMQRIVNRMESLLRHKLK